MTKKGLLTFKIFGVFLQDDDLSRTNLTLRTADMTRTSDWPAKCPQWI